MRTAHDLLSELNAADESPRIEAKRSREIGKSIIETVLAFANEPGLGGGHLLLGVDSRVDEKGDTRYWPEGPADPDKIQKDLATQCASMLNVAIPSIGILNRASCSWKVVTGARKVVSGLCRTCLRTGGTPSPSRMSASISARVKVVVASVMRPTVE